MKEHHSPLDIQESLGGPFLRSLLVHVLIVLVFAGGSLFGGRSIEQFGSEDARAGAATVTAVKALPFPNRSPRLNPVANDTESMVPKPPEPAKPKPAPDPSAVAIGKKDRKKKQTEKKIDIARYLRDRERRLAEQPPNQLTSDSGERAATPLFSPAAGGGQLAVGANNPFGNRFGAYAQALRECVGRNWKTAGIMRGNYRTAVITFEILRNGSIRSTRVVESSGNAELDFASRRAIEDCNPFQPLPTGFERSSATVELLFELKR